MSKSSSESLASPQEAVYQLSRKDAVIVEVILHVGRPFEVLSMADYLASTGYNVGVLLQQHSRDAFTIKQYVKEARFKYLKAEDFVRVRSGDLWDVMERIRPRFAIVPEFVITRCPERIGVPLFVWCLRPHRCLSSVQADMHILANTHTTREVLYRHPEGFDRDVKVKALTAPIDYSEFRKAAKPWAVRTTGVIAVTRVGHPTAERKNSHLYDEIPGIVKITDKPKLIMDRKKIAEAMGNARVFLHLSQWESGPLVAYEALNAGCYPLFYDTGAVHEQLGSEEYLLDDLDISSIRRRIDEVVSGRYDPQVSIERGLLFDRQTVGPRFTAYIESQL